MSLVGRLEDLGLSDIFQILSVGRKTGILIIKGSQGSAMIVFKNGLVVKGESSIGGNTIGDDLLKNGHIKKSTLDMAVEVRRQLPKKSVADILNELGAVRKDVLEKAARKRIEKVVCHILQWQDGDFQFELEDLNVNGKVDLADPGWEVSKGLSPEYLLMEGARVYDESSHGLLIEEEQEETSEETDWDSDWGAGGGRKDISSLAALTQELRFPNSTSEITLLILRFASEIFQRGVLFMVGDNKISGLGQFGLGMDDADQKIRQTVLSYNNSPFLADIIKEGRHYKGPVEKDKGMEAMLKELGEYWPSEAAIFPLVAEGKVVALLYADNLPEDREIGETEGLEIFISQAGLALEKAILHRRLQEFEKKG